MEYKQRNFCLADSLTTALTMNLLVIGCRNLMYPMLPLFILAPVSYTHLDVYKRQDYTRLNVEHRMFEPEKGKYSFDNREMMVLYKYLDYFGKNGVTVQLQEMYPNVKWLAHHKQQSDAVGIIKSGPSNIEAWSDGIIALLKHLLIDKKYTCIQYLGIANEPHHGWSWWKEADGRTSQAIIPALTLLRNKIQKEKIPVLLTGPEAMFYFLSLIHI